MASKLKSSLSQKQLFIILAAILAVVVIFLVVRANIRETKDVERVSLTVWGTEPKSALDDLFRAYTTNLRPNISISYEQIRAEQYREALLSALASGEGPDVFMVGNRELFLQKSLIAPVTESQFTLGRFRSTFPTVVEQDFTEDEAIFAFPLYLDTLALVYNKNSFDQAGIATIPRTWQEFIELIPRLRLLNAQGQIVRAGAAIGGSQETIEYAVDILNLLMLQNGSEIVDARRESARFAEKEGPGAEAFAFYLQFANAGSPFYTWNDARPKGLENFVTGNAAMTFAYQRDIETLARRNPFLEFGVAAMPQVNPENAVQYARYDGLAVSKQSAVPEWAWDFIIYITTEQATLSKYLERTGKPSALRARVAEELKDPDLNVFAGQALTARSWPMKDPARATEIFDEAIKNVLAGKLNAESALRQAEEQITQLMR